MSAGIDYGRGMTNIDTETGIRYGVIFARSIGQAWYDAAEPVYPDISDVVDVAELRAELGESAAGKTDDELLAEADYPDWIDTDCMAFNDEGYSMQERGDSGFGIFVFRSPYYTLCRYCSPCAPGAGDLDSPDPDGIRAYAPGHDWFETGRAPYPVYSVETGQIVEPS